MLKKHQTACLIFIGAVFLSFAFWAVASEETETKITKNEKQEIVEEKISNENNDDKNESDDKPTEKHCEEAEEIEDLEADTPADVVLGGDIIEEENVLPNENLKDGEDDPIRKTTDDKKEKETEERGGDEVFINEIAWMGMPTSASDEWIELFNKGKDVDLAGWVLKTEDDSIKINLKGKLGSGEYFLLERTDDESVPNIEADQLYSGSLGNDGEKIFLIDAEGRGVDEVVASSGWPAGENETKKTMEKTSDGWQTSFVIGGTPRRKNSQKSDEEGDDNNGGDEEIIYSKKITINEILPNPVGDEEAGEWMELYCFDGEGVDLENWLLQDAGGKKYFFGKERIENGGFLIIERSKSAIALNNSGDETVYLKDPRGAIVSSLNYHETYEGLSYALEEDGEYQWTEILTPGEKNEFPEKKIYPRNILFNEIMSNPSGADKNNEWVELFNGNDFEVDLQGWKISNGQDKFFQIEGVVAPPVGLVVIEIKNSSFAIRNNEELLKLIDPNNEEVDKLEITGAAKQGSSYNKSKHGKWSWIRFFTPGKFNRINNPPKIKIEIDDKIYKNIKADFDASGSNDKDGDELKFRWDFGDGHYSYLEKISHKYEKKGRYKVILRIDDGSVQIFKEIEVKVDGFPEYDLKIMRLVPNPAGADTGKEEIEIKNNELKDVDLKNWKIATGSEEGKMTDHPIYEEIVIRAGQSFIIKNTDCHFFLPNKKGSVALVYPNGKEADRVVYIKDSIEENEEYFLIGNGWTWFNQKNSSHISVLGDNISNQLTEGKNKRYEVIFWQELMSDKINLKTLNLRGLMIHNWFLREQKWKIFAIPIKTKNQLSKC